MSREIDSEVVDERIKDVILPEYFQSVAPAGVLEVLHPTKFGLADKLAWNYIQKLQKRGVAKSMPDALNYAWASVGGVDFFVTKNRRGILAPTYRTVLKKCNSKFRLKFVEVLTPKEFYDYLF